MSLFTNVRQFQVDLDLLHNFIQVKVKKVCLAEWTLHFEKNYPSHSKIQLVLLSQQINCLSQQCVAYFLAIQHLKSIENNSSSFFFLCIKLQERLKAHQKVLSQVHAYNCIKQVINLSTTLKVDHTSSQFFQHLQTYLSLMKNYYTLDSLRRVCNQKLKCLMTGQIKWNFIFIGIFWGFQNFESLNNLIFIIRLFKLCSKSKWESSRKNLAGFNSDNVKTPLRRLCCFQMTLSFLQVLQKFLPIPLSLCYM